ncbi:hypothetical protein HanPSC8_Chr15g0644441 [Helianthus annuus]|nr:hypothetical protein HanPSC8_Chr15g0644441 [Helianthus annuus]
MLSMLLEKSTWWSNFCFHHCTLCGWCCRFSIAFAFVSGRFKVVDLKAIVCIVFLSWLQLKGMDDILASV